MLKTSLDMAIIALRVNSRLIFPQIDFEQAKSSRLLWRNHQFPLSASVVHFKVFVLLLDVNASWLARNEAWR